MTKIHSSRIAVVSVIDSKPLAVVLLRALEGTRAFRTLKAAGTRPSLAVTKLCVTAFKRSEALSAEQKSNGSFVLKFQFIQFCFVSKEKGQGLT